MSGSVNKVIIIGSLGADPELKSFSNGGRICNLRVATNEDWKDRTTGEKKRKTEWHSVTIHGDGLTGVAERFLRKGSKVYLEGQLATRKWQDSAGQDRYSTEVVLRGPGAVMTMLDGPKGDERTMNPRPADNRRRPGDQGYIAPVDGYDDDSDGPPF